MKVKLFESYLNETIIDSNLTIQNPNFSIVMPGGCNAKCKFCFWEKNKTCKNYLENLSNILNKLPDNFTQISITGGEPTISPYLKEVLNLIDKSKFKKVVLTTNGHKLLETLHLFEGIVDHVNISRHHDDEEINNKIFGTKMVDKKTLKIITNELNKIGIDVTFSSVLNENLKTSKDVKNYINFAKECGSSQIFFRKPHGTISPSSTEKLYEDYKYDEFKCPACRSRYQLIEGMNIIWKSSLMEPSLELNKIYELIFNEKGELTKDWEGNSKVDINENFSMDYKLNEECGGGFGGGCGSWSSISGNGTNGTSSGIRKSGKKKMTDSEMINMLYDRYMNNFKKYDVVIYNKKGHKHDGMEFFYLHEDDNGKAVLTSSYSKSSGEMGFKFVVNPDNIRKKEDNLENFSKIINNMIDNGFLSKEPVDKFFKMKKLDPYGEENWD